MLDYGCGWGRQLRLMYKYIPFDRIYGVDPWDKSIEICHSCRLKGNLAISEYVPTSLPFERTFDLIYAFSVFTHLSERTALRVLSTLRRYIADGGLLFITIRPREYWNVHGDGSLSPEKLAEHDSRGFAFFPHGREPIDGDITYGDTSLTLDWLRQAQSDWLIDSTEYSMGDSLQVIVTLKPA
jgi:SAM-dependent methyltransferase